MKLILVRHCEANRGASKEDYGLTDEGHSHALQVAQSLPKKPDIVLCSPLTRAIETANYFTDNYTSRTELAEIGELGSEEDLDVFIHRVLTTMESIRTEHTGKEVVAFTHAGFIMASIRGVFSVPTPGAGARLEPKYGSRTTWIYNDSTWYLDGYNIEAIAT